MERYFLQKRLGWVYFKGYYEVIEVGWLKNSLLIFPFKRYNSPYNGIVPSCLVSGFLKVLKVKGELKVVSFKTKSRSITKVFSLV